jgi:hypothetical protein
VNPWTAANVIELVKATQQPMMQQPMQAMMQQPMIQQPENCLID